MRVFRTAKIRRRVWFGHSTLAVVLLTSGWMPAQEKSSIPVDAKPEVISVLGTKHYSKTDEKGEIAKVEANLSSDPKNIDRFLALGRAQAGAWRYRDAINTYTKALEHAPNDARLYRHRGHRYISVRQFDQAVADLKRAAQINDRSFDIWYHLGLAHYLRGEFAEALAAYQKCYAVADANRNAATPDKEGRDDSLIAVSDWLYMTNRRLNQRADAEKLLAPIKPESKVKDNKSYFNRLMFYKGLKSEDDLLQIKTADDPGNATVLYGLANWHLYNGNRAKADEYFRRIVKGSNWPAFGFIAAEVDLARQAERKD